MPPSRSGVGSQDPSKGRVLDVMVQPEGLQLPRQDDWHPVMDGAKQLVGRRGNDGAGADDLALRVPPRIPETREGEGLPRRHHDPHGPPAGALPFPLIETIGQDQAPSSLERSAEAGPLGDRLSAGVYHPATHRRALGPGRNQPPAHVSTDHSP